MVEYWNLSVPGVDGTAERRAYLYLPACYEAEPARRFPVLYMFDGHNVFFDSHATYGKSWGMAEYLDRTRTPLIVAAVECNHGPNNERLAEYTPYSFRNPRFGNVKAFGRETMEWFVRSFKPEIDRRARTLPDRRHTFIGGSSMGGLMSLYAVTAYNQVFSPRNGSVALAVGLAGTAGTGDRPGQAGSFHRGVHGLRRQRVCQPRCHAGRLCRRLRPPFAAPCAADRAGRPRRRALRGQLGAPAALCRPRLDVWTLIGLSYLRRRGRRPQKPLTFSTVQPHAGLRLCKSDRFAICSLQSRKLML